jgi:hypothetical protein
MARWTSPFTVFSKAIRAKLSVDGGESSFDGATYQDFFGDAIADQIGHADDLQTVDAGELAQLRQARHRPVFVHDFADDAGRIKSGDPRHVDGRFRLSGSHQYPTFFRAQRKHVTGPGQVLWFRPWIDSRENCGGADRRRKFRW